MVHQNSQEETSNSRTPLRESIMSREHFNREEFQFEEIKDDAEVRNDFWSTQGDFIFSHRIDSRVQSYVLKEESFLIPLKYFDVIRSTHTDSDVAKEKRIDD